MAKRNGRAWICISQWLTGCQTGSSLTPPDEGCESYAEDPPCDCECASEHGSDCIFKLPTPTSLLRSSLWTLPGCGCAPIKDLEKGIYDEAIQERIDDELIKRSKKA